ncbi:hypothetical protein [Streptomyces sp. NPDC050704]|uniref:hypothetical protein n=1 Tax=Streptomyces sp. NPDC050704 TaxID=3157219 RepID=UPI003434AB33
MTDISNPELPPITVVLLDGQELRGRLHEREQTRRGPWTHCVGLALWATKNGTTEPAEHVVWLPADQVRPVDGSSYDAVPTRAH